MRTGLTASFGAITVACTALLQLLPVLGRLWIVAVVKWLKEKKRLLLLTSGHDKTIFARIKQWITQRRKVLCSSKLIGC